MNDAGIPSSAELEIRILETGAWYRQIRDRITSLACLHIAAVAREDIPTAKWVGLTTTDQDDSGGQWVTCVITNDGVIIEGDDIDGEFEFTLDLDDQTMHIWAPHVDEGVKKRFPNLDKDDDQYLDLDSILLRFATANAEPPEGP